MRSHHPLLLAATIALLPVAASAQDARSYDWFSTDRPAYSMSTTAVPRGAVLLESGVNAGRRGPLRTEEFGELWLRAGVLDRLELRVGALSQVTSRVGGVRETSTSDVHLGVKWRAADGVDGTWRPALALQLETTVSGASPGTPVAQAAAEWSFIRGGWASINTQGTWRETTDGDRTLASGMFVAGGADIVRTLGGFFEHAVFWADGASRPSLAETAGLTWRVGPRWQLDGWGSFRQGDGAPPGLVLGAGLAAAW